MPPRIQKKFSPKFFSAFTPTLQVRPPGTKVFDRLGKEGRLLIKNEDELILNNLYYNTSCNRCFFIPKHMSVEEAEVKFIDLNRRLCSFREILWRSVTVRPSELAFLLYMNLAFRSDVKKMIAAHNNSSRKSG